MKVMLELSVVLPVCNEEAVIESVIGKIVKTLKEKVNCEIIAVENGSTDLSFQKLQKLKLKYSTLRVFQSEKGWGNALKEGIKHARGRYFCYMVSDNQVDSGYILDVFQKISLENYTLVKVSRVKRENFSRFLNSKLYNYLARILFGISNPDINGTPKVIKTSLIKKLNLQSENIAFDLELLYKLNKRKYVLKDIPVISGKRDTGISKTTLFSVLEMLIQMFKLRFNML